MSDGSAGSCRAGAWRALRASHRRQSRWLGYTIGLTCAGGGRQASSAVRTLADSALNVTGMLTTEDGRTRTGAAQATCGYASDRPKASSELQRRASCVRDARSGGRQAGWQVTTRVVSTW